MGVLKKKRKIFILGEFKTATQGIKNGTVMGEGVMSLREEVS